MLDNQPDTRKFSDFALLEPYSTRRIRFLDLWDVDGWRIKLYGIRYKGDSPDPMLVERAKALAARELASFQERVPVYGVGYVGVHDARSGPLAFLDIWANENEIRHFAYTAPESRPDLLHRAQREQVSYCIWDMTLADFERRAWHECMLTNPDGPDMDAYLARRMDTRF
jgi:hypothetical protein